MSSNVEAPERRREWLSIAELAKELGMSQMTLYRVIAAGEFPVVRIGRPPVRADPCAGSAGRIGPVDRPAGVGR